MSNGIFHGREAKWEEWDIMCSVQGCTRGMYYWVDHKIPVCAWHMKEMKELEKLGLRAELDYTKASPRRKRASPTAVIIPDAPVVAELPEELGSRGDHDKADDDWESRFAQGEFD